MLSRLSTDRRAHVSRIAMLSKLRQLSVESPLVGGPRFAAGDIGGKVRIFVKMADDVTPEAQATISKALAEIGCTVEADDLDASADGYEADDVKCKDGEFEVSFNKDFKIIAKEKDEY